VDRHCSIIVTLGPVLKGVSTSTVDANCGHIESRSSV